MEEKIAKYLLDIKAVTLRPNNPFKWASGIYAPIYTDNRLTLSYPKIRKVIELGLVQLIKTYYPNVEMIMGTATAGIPHAALVADILELPMGYVRTNAKEHGKNNIIEGHIEPNKKVVVIEDLISTGGSSLEVVKTLKEQNLEVLGVVSIFTYLFKEAEINFQNSGVTYHSLSNYHSLLKVALNETIISSQEYEQLSAWYQEPSSQGWMNEETIIK